MPAPNPKTNPDCGAPRHGSLRAARQNCACPEAAAKVEQRRSNSRASAVSRGSIAYSAVETSRFKSRLSPQASGCIEWTGERMKLDYGVFTVTREGQRCRRLAHRVAYQLASGDDPMEWVVRHKCDNPPCCNPQHLLLGTQADNVRDAVERKRLKTAHLAIGRQPGNGPREPRELRKQGLKRCSGCREVKPEEEFYFQNVSERRRKSKCKPCVEAGKQSAAQARRAERDREGYVQNRPRGEAHGMSKLTGGDVEAIRRDERRLGLVAFDYGVSKSAVWRIRSGRSWRGAA